MLDVLPSELSLKILSYLPIPSLYSLFTLSRQWHDFLFANQWSIFRHAAILHGYIEPGLQLEDALARYTGSPWEGSIDWKDFCKSIPSLKRLEPFRIPASESTFLVFFTTKVAGLFNLIKTGRAKVALLRAHYPRQITTCIASKSMKRLGYASRPTRSAVSP
jgi:F-box-like